MKAIIYEEYGSPEVLKYMEVETPVPKPNEVLVKNYASSINYGDNALIRGSPFVAHTRAQILSAFLELRGCVLRVCMYV